MAACITTSSLGTPPGTYLYALASSNSSLATIGSDDTLHIFDSKLKPLQSTKCHAGVTCLQAGGQSHFVTGGRDGVVRCWDARKDTRLKQDAEIADPRANGIASIACHEHYIAAGTESLKEGLGDVSVLVFDTRKPGAPLRQYNESHTDTVTQVKFHPSQPNVLLSGSTDGLVSIFNVNQEDEEDALQQVLNPRSAVHCSGFLSHDLAYVVSMDEQYSIYQLAKTNFDDEQLPPPIQFGDVRQTLDCMYVVDVLLQPDGPPLIAYGHNENQQLAISSLGTPGAWSFGKTIDLPGGHGDDVVRGLLVLGQRAYSCGEDGNVKAWALG